MIHRRDVAAITARAETELLAAHHIHPGHLIATGTEARIYALDDTRVLKVYADPDGTQHARLDALHAFYDQLDRDAVPYALPRIHRIEQHDPLLATIEELLPGQPMGTACDLTANSTQAIYLNAVTALGRLHEQVGTRSRMLLADPDSTGAGSKPWHTFLQTLLDAKLDIVGASLAADIPGFAELAGRLRDALAKPYKGPEAVIHGDLYPDNILMTDTTTVSAVIDFGTFTMTGDPLYDLAGACIYYRQYEPDRTTTWKKLLDQAAARYTPQQAAALRTYAEIIAIVSCDLYPQDGTPIQSTGHYQWAVTVLRDLEWPA